MSALQPLLPKNTAPLGQFGGELGFKQTGRAKPSGVLDDSSAKTLHVRSETNETAHAAASACGFA